MGPGLTVLDNYQRTNQIQDQAQAGQINRAAGALSLVDKIQQAQRAASVRRAYAEHAGNLGALEDALIREGALGDAEKARKLRGEREYEAEVQGALGPDGSVDWNKVALASTKRGNSGAALNAAWRADQAATKRRDEDQRRGALRYLLGEQQPGGAAGALSETGELPEEGMKPNPPARAGALSEYEASENPAVRRQAKVLRDLIQAGAMEPRDAVRQLGALASGDVRVGIEGAKEEGRNARAEARQEEMVRWDSKRGVGFTRGGQVVLPKDLPGLPATGAAGGGANAEPKAMQYARWRIKTLVEAGATMEDAQRIVAGGASMQVSPSTRAQLATKLMQLKEGDFVTPVYPTLGAAMQAVDEALGANKSRQGALPASPEAMPGSLSEGATGVPAAQPRAPTLDGSPRDRYQPAPRDPAKRVKGEIYVSPKTGGYVKWTGTAWEAVD